MALCLQRQGMLRILSTFMTLLSSSTSPIYGLVEVTLSMTMATMAMTTKTMMATTTILMKLMKMFDLSRLILRGVRKSD